MASVSVLTPPGRGAVTTLRIVGIDVLEKPFPLFVAANQRSLAQQPLDRICFGRWGDVTPEDVVACRVSDDVVEIHCHGGDAAVTRIVGDLRSRGCVQDSGQRLVVDHLRDAESEHERIEVECRQAVSRATTVRTADILWQQCQGRLARAITALVSVPPERAQEQAAQLLRWAEFGRRLTQPGRVVLCGRPNVGKSSLINALVGFGRSIVFDQPGTTRDVVTVETALDGWPVELSDTAGLRESADELERAGIQRARRQLETADLRVIVLDTSRQALDEDYQLLTECPDAVVVAHKCDLPVKWKRPLLDQAIAVSSITGDGVNRLAEVIVRRLVPEIPSPRTLVPVNARQVEFLSEIAAGRR